MSLQSNVSNLLANSSAPLAPKVLSYQHPELVERLKRELSLSTVDANELFMDLKKFLLLCGLRPDGGFVPTKAIDTAWHHFILYTRDYASFCQNMFGQFIHHLPTSYFVPERHDEEFDLTLEFARELFGELGTNWKQAIARSGQDPCWRPGSKYA